MPPMLMQEPAALLPAITTANRMAAPRVPTRARDWIGAGLAPMLGGALAALVALVLYVVADRQLDLFGRGAPPAAAVAQAAAHALAQAQSPRPPAFAAPLAEGGRVPSSGLPLPSVYGLYAVSNGELAELHALPGRVPDQKVFMSTPIKTPSQAMVPDGRLAFIIYRRDIAASAPERVQVRVIAKVMRAMTFTTAGQANTASVDDQWTIRGNAYDLRVAPVVENAEMLLLRPENSDFVFSPGRYALVLKGQAYDFTVAGTITDAAQCLERIEAANGAFYAECRNP
jgi:CBS domain-containing protein